MAYIDYHYDYNKKRRLKKQVIKYLEKEIDEEIINLHNEHISCIIKDRPTNRFELMEIE